jgi:hypothetical protein
MFRRFLRPHWVAPIVLLLTACANAPQESSPSVAQSPEERGEAALASGDNSIAAQAFEEAADHAGNPASAAQLHLRAADAAFAGHDPTTAQALLGRVSTRDLNPSELGRFRVLSARCALARGDAAGAYRDVAGASPDHASADPFLLLRGQALFALGQPLQATAALVAREPFLADSALRENRDVLWTGLGSSRLSTIAPQSLHSADAVTRGWVELAQLANRGATPQQVTEWRAHYPNHPANSRLTAMLAANGGVAPHPTSAPAPLAVLPPPPAAAAAGGSAIAHGPVALLLPHTGPLATVGDIVRQGFTAEFTREGGAPGDIRDYDSSLGAAAAARQAVAQGATLIVGPLSKEHVAEITSTAPPSVPMIALNYLDSAAPRGSAQLYQFGLAPEDEAREAVREALAHGLKRAVALIPANDWGSRILNAFSSDLLAQGGQLIASGQYPSGTYDYSQEVKTLLGLDTSTARMRAVSAVLGEHLEFAPVRRPDIDFVFLVARPAQARLIVPMFRFYRAENLPIYATSAVNEARANPDFYGVRFCDSPWLLRGDADWERYRTAIDSALAGQHRELDRLYAMGSDAARLTQHLRAGGLPAGTAIQGLTGTLVPDDHGVIHRQLVCAVLGGGVPQLLDDAPLPAPP